MNYLLYDTGFFAYRFAAGNSEDFDFGNGWFIHGCNHDNALNDYICHTQELLEAFPGYSIFLVKGDKRTFRHDLWPNYKANRKDRRAPAGYGIFLEGLTEYAKGRGWLCGGFHNVEDDDVLAVGLSRAVELLAMPKRGRGGRTALKDLGTPEGSEETIQVYDGPYGLYVKQGKVNASLPEGKKADEVTLEEAVELLAAKASAKKSSRKSTAKKPAAKKAAAKKPAAKKTPATTKTGRLRASAVRVIKPADN